MHTEFVLPDGRRIVQYRSYLYKLYSVHGGFQRMLIVYPGQNPVCEGMTAKPVKPDQGMYGGTLDVV